MWNLCTKNDGIFLIYRIFLDEEHKNDRIFVIYRIKSVTII